MSVRRRLPALLIAFAAACGGEPSAPVPAAPALDAALGADVATLATLGAAPALAPRGPVVGGVSLDRLPGALRLSDAQRAALDALARTFAEATRADVATVAAVAARAEAALKAGRPAAEVRAILADATEARRRLDEATRALAASARALLTPEQRAWLDAQAAPRCDRDAAPPLSAEQAARIRALQQAFVAATRADLEAATRIAAEALAARQAGKPDAEVRAILARATPIRERLAAAEAKLRADVEAVLTPAQRASRCPVVLPPVAPR